jgi:hypothetical protein
MKLPLPIVALALSIVVSACGTSGGTADSSPVGVGPSTDAQTPVPASSSAIVLRPAPPDLGCDSIGWEGERYRTLTFHVDPGAAEQVWAESDGGAMLATYWSAGFQPGTEPGVILDPMGGVFVTDGDVVEVPEAANLEIHGYFVCLRPDRLYVLTRERG